MASTVKPAPREWFEDTMVSIRRVDRAGGPRKTHAVRTSWLIKHMARTIGETDTRREAREVAAIYVAMMRLAGAFRE